MLQTGPPFQITYISAKPGAQDARLSQYAYLDRLCVCGCLCILPCNGGVGLWCNLVYDMIKGYWLAQQGFFHKQFVCVGVCGWVRVCVWAERLIAFAISRFEKNTISQL